MLLLATILAFVACSSGDEVWGLRIGQSRESVAKQLKGQGYKIENFSEDSYISIDEKVEYQGIEWDEVTCWFDDNNKLKIVEFDTYGPRPDYQIEKLTKYIKEEGYPELKEDERLSGFYISDKLPMTVMLSIGRRVTLHYCKDAHKRGD